MKRNLFLISFAILSAFLILNTSCSKKGCTDPNSINYNPDAEEDDGSCEYEGSLVFWYGKQTSDFFVSNGISTLTYYVDGKFVGSCATSVYWTGAPDCGQNSSITFTKILRDVGNYPSTFSIKDQTGWECFNGEVRLTANTCKSIELIFK